MVSYETGSSNVEFTTAGAALKGISKDNSTNTASGYGLRLGLVADSGLWLAGNYTATASGAAKYLNHNETFTRIATGAELGFRDIRWNFWVGYNSSDIMTFIQENGVTKDFAKGTSMKIGIGYLLYYHIVLNVEYISRTYNLGQIDSADVVYTDFPTYIKSFTQQSTQVGLSFPF
jgi:hypothetical protein